jgi:site-specific recombinase XerD
MRAVLAVPNRKAPTGLRNRTMVVLMSGAGLRVSEVVNLRTRDLSKAGTRLRVIDGKGGDRYVHLSDDVTAALREWLAVRDELAPGSPWVFPQVRSTAYRDPQAKADAKERGSQLTTSYVRAMTARLGKKANVERRTNPHAFRHTAATAMVDANYTLPEVQATLGHRNLATTSVYLHVSNERLAERMKTFRPPWFEPE